MNTMKDREEFSIYYDIAVRLAMVVAAKVLTTQESDALLDSTGMSLSEVYSPEKVKLAVDRTKVSVDAFRKAFNTQEVDIDENN